MTVIARDMGQRNGKYLVNVRNAEPKGLLGDAGVVRQFDDKDIAKNYIEQVNKTGEDTFVKNEVNNQAPLPLKRHAGDTFKRTEQ